MPKVSVIIPNYNHSKFLKQRIDSVLNQSYQDFELIILDDCSTDNSREVIEDFRLSSKISHIIYNEINSGSPFKQWQKGIELAKGEYIWIAESDDYSESNFLENSTKALNKCKNAAIYFCQSYVVKGDVVIGDMHWWTNDIKNLNWHKPFNLSGFYFIETILNIKNVIANASGVLIRKNCIKNNLNLIINYKMCGDWLLYILILADKEIIYSNLKMNYFRMHDNTTRQNLNTNQKILRLIEEIAIKNFIIKKFSAIEGDLPQIWQNLFMIITLESRKYLVENLREFGIHVTLIKKMKIFFHIIKNTLISIIKSLIPMK